MKLFSFNRKTTKKARRNRRSISDYYQESLNSYGRQQIKSLLDKGLSVQW